MYLHPQFTVNFDSEVGWTSAGLSLMSNVMLMDRISKCSYGRNEVWFGNLRVPSLLFFVCVDEVGFVGFVKPID